MQGIKLATTDIHQVRTKEQKENDVFYDLLDRKVHGCLSLPYLNKRGYLTGGNKLLVKWFNQDASFSFRIAHAYVDLPTQKIGENDCFYFKNGIF